MGNQCSYDGVVEEKIFIAAGCKMHAASYELLAVRYEL